MSGVRGEAGEGVGRGHGGDLIERNEQRGGEGGSGAVAEHRHFTRGGVGATAGVAADGIDVDLLSGGAGVIAGKGEGSVGVGGDVVVGAVEAVVQRVIGLNVAGEQRR